MAPTSTEGISRINRAPLRRVGLLVAVLAVVPYLNSLDGQFVFDDMAVIRDNAAITGRNASVRGALTYVYEPGGYRPLTMLTYLANAFAGGGVVAYHTVNVGLHALVTVAVLYVAYHLVGSTLIAGVTAVLFAVHPIHTEAVSGIVGRSEVLTALFTLVSVLALVSALRSGRRQTLQTLWWAVSVGAMGCALLSKENGFTTIPLCAVVYLWMRPRSTFRELAGFLIPYAVVGLAYLGLRLAVVGSLTMPTRPDLLDNPLAYVPMLPRLATAATILAQYLSLLLAPVWLSADYSFNQIPVVASVADPRFIAAGTLFVLLGLLVVSTRREPTLLLATALTCIPMALTANILFPIGTIKAERLLYLPSVGWCLGVAWLVSRGGKDRYARVVRGMVVILVVAYAARTWVRNGDWHDNYTLFTSALRVSPGSAKTHHNLATTYDWRGQTEAALFHYRQADSIYPEAGAAFAVGRMYDKMGLDAEALDWYARATQRDWHYVSAHLNMALLRHRRAEYVLAEADFRAGLESEPDDPRLLMGLSVTLRAAGRTSEAEDYFRRAEAAGEGQPDMVTAIAEVRDSLRRGGVR